MMPLLRRTQPIGRNDIREKATRLQVRHLATKPRHLLRCASNMMTVKQAQAEAHLSSTLSLVPRQAGTTKHRRECWNCYEGRTWGKPHMC